MVSYECLRCGYIGKQKGHLVKHLNRKKICSPIYNEISIEEIQDFYNLNNSNIFQKNSSIFQKNSKKKNLRFQTIPKYSKIFQKMEYKTNVFTVVKSILIKAI